VSHNEARSTSPAHNAAEHRIVKIIESKGPGAADYYRGPGRSWFARELAEDHVPAEEIAAFLHELDAKFDDMLLDDLLESLKARHQGA
jgi:hypothetical protein